jgi:hypothetical protein
VSESLNGLLSKAKLSLEELASNIQNSKSRSKSKAKSAVVLPTPGQKNILAEFDDLNKPNVLDEAASAMQQQDDPPNHIIAPSLSNFLIGLLDGYDDSELMLQMPLPQLLLSSFPLLLEFLFRLVNLDDDDFSLHAEVQNATGLQKNMIWELYLRLDIVRQIFRTGGIFEKRTKEFELVWRAVACICGISKHREFLQSDVKELISNYNEEHKQTLNPKHSDFSFLALFYSMHSTTLESAVDPMKGVANLRFKKILMIEPEN